MNEWYLRIAAFILLNLLIGLVRILRGPTRADRMLAAQLFGTTCVAMLLLLAQGFGSSTFQNMALVYSLLAAMATVAFIKRAWHYSDLDEGESHEY